MRRLLRVLPFSLFYVLISAAKRVIQLRGGHELVCAGEVVTGGEALPCSVMIWLDRVAVDLSEPHFDVCLKLPHDAPDANLHDVFSILLTSPRLRSVGLYWDSASSADDLSLWQGRQDHREAMVWSKLGNDVAARSVQRLHEFFTSFHDAIVLPVAATRDAQTLLKRHVGGAYAVCMNVPAELRSLADAIRAARPDVRFFDLATDAVPPSDGAANSQSLAGCGLSLHERLALAQATDAYVGSFDELGCAALVSGVPAVLLGGGTSEHPDRISHGDNAVWFPGPVEPTAAASAVLQFLSPRLGPAEN